MIYLLIFLLLLGVFIVFACMLTVNLTFHEFLSSVHFTTLAVVARVVFLFMRLILAMLLVNAA